MKLKFNLQLLAILLFVFTTSMGLARDYIIYSIAQDIPMGHKDEVIKRNFYVNMGKSQGVEQGTTLDVYRTISRLDPYESKTRYNYKVKIAELKVLHSEEGASIARLTKVEEAEDTPFFEIDGPMIGDKIGVKID